MRSDQKAETLEILMKQRLAARLFEREEPLIRYQLRALRRVIKEIAIDGVPILVQVRPVRERIGGFGRHCGGGDHDAAEGQYRCHRHLAEGSEQSSVLSFAGMT